MTVHRNFPLVALALAVAATPALGQDVAPTVGAANNGTPNVVSSPDFSGTWSHPYCCGFDPPLSGPGPVANLARRRQIVDADGRPLPATNTTLVADTSRMVGDFKNPILKPEAAEVVRRFGEIELTGVSKPTPGNQCLPEGVPYIFWNFGMQLLQGLDKIVIIYNEDHEIRHVRMNEPHPTQLTPSWYGDSIGHYEGDTLVIDTVGIKVGPHSMIDIYGTPHTEALHVVERYRLIDYEAMREALERAGKENFRVRGADDSGLLIDPNYKGKGLQLEFTVEDNGVFTMPWSATITYRRVLDELAEKVCAENIHEYYAHKDTAVPHADKPDF
jgi:hypothetical protein